MFRYSFLLFTILWGMEEEWYSQVSVLGVAVDADHQRQLQLSIAVQAHR